MENTINNWKQMTYPFSNLTLNYNFSALEPSIDLKTLQSHYDLLSAHIKKLNNNLDNRLDLQSMTLCELLAYAESNQDIELRRQVGAVYNHFFFFSELRPATGQIVIGITPQATQKITSTFGGWKPFKEQFANTALNLFGSGYVWLIKNSIGELKITITNNEVVPSNCTPILYLDMWEHAFYLQHLNKKENYINTFWNIVDWVKFSEKL